MLVIPTKDAMLTISACLLIWDKQPHPHRATRCIASLVNSARRSEVYSSLKLIPDSLLINTAAYFNKRIVNRYFPPCPAVHSRARGWKTKDGCGADMSPHSTNCQCDAKEAGLTVLQSHPTHGQIDPRGFRIRHWYGRHFLIFFRCLS